jgi:hypothetical protein
MLPVKIRSRGCSHPRLCWANVLGEPLREGGGRLPTCEGSGELLALTAKMIGSGGICFLSKVRASSCNPDCCTKERAAGKEKEWVCTQTRRCPEWTTASYHKQATSVAIRPAGGVLRKRSAAPGMKRTELCTIQ